MPRFFVSYVYEDRKYRDQIVDWHRRGLLGRWEPCYEAEDVRPGGWRAVQRYLSPLIRQSQALLVLVGDNTHNHAAVDYEVQDARSARIPVVAVRLPNTRGAPPPSVALSAAAFMAQDLATTLDGAR